MEKEIICTICPRGCHIRVNGQDETVTSIEGYSCKRGLEYAAKEFTHPVRILTTTVKLADTENDLLPVRSAKPLPKEKLFDCMKVLRTAQVTVPVARYDVIIPDICGTGIDIISTKTIG